MLIPGAVAAQDADEVSNVVFSPRQFLLSTSVAMQLLCIQKCASLGVSAPKRPAQRPHLAGGHLQGRHGSGLVVLAADKVGREQAGVQGWPATPRRRPPMPATKVCPPLPARCAMLCQSVTPSYYKMLLQLDPRYGEGDIDLGPKQASPSFQDMKNAQAGDHGRAAHVSSQELCTALCSC